MNSLLCYFAVGIGCFLLGAAITRHHYERKLRRFSDRLKASSGALEKAVQNNKEQE